MSNVAERPTHFSPPQQILGLLNHSATSPGRGAHSYPDPLQLHAAAPSQSHTPLPLGAQQSSGRPQNESSRPSTPAEVKGRLRKACDSCSVRKVKVPTAMELPPPADTPGPANTFALRSAMKAVRPVALAPPWTFPVPSRDRVAGAALPIDMPKRSRDRDWSRVWPPAVAFPPTMTARQPQAGSLPSLSAQCRPSSC